MISAIPPVPQMMGVPRIVTGQAVTCPLGNPKWPLEQEKALRRRIVLQALEAIATPVEGTTIFHVA